MTAAIEFREATGESAASVWLELLPQIERALRGRPVTAADYLKLILQGHRKLWVATRGDEVVAAVVVSVRDEHGERIVYVDLCAGRDLDAWVSELERLLRDYRDLTDSDRIGCECRPGLARRLERRGWSVVSYAMEMD